MPQNRLLAEFSASSQRASWGHAPRCGLSSADLKEVLVDGLFSVLPTWSASAPSEARSTRPRFTTSKTSMEQIPGTTNGEASVVMASPGSQSGDSPLTTCNSGQHAGHEPPVAAAAARTTTTDVISCCPRAQFARPWPPSAPPQPQAASAPADVWSADPPSWQVYPWVSIQMQLYFLPISGL